MGIPMSVESASINAWVCSRRLQSANSLPAALHRAVALVDGNVTRTLFAQNELVVHFNFVSTWRTAVRLELVQRAEESEKTRWRPVLEFQCLTRALLRMLWSVLDIHFGAIFKQ